MQSVAACAIGEKIFQLFVARHGHDPFRIRHLCAKIFCLGQFHRDRLHAFADGDLFRAFQIIANGANGNFIISRAQSSCGKSKSTFVIADHGDGFIRAGLFRADQDTFERALWCANGAVEDGLGQSKKAGCQKKGTCPSKCLRQTTHGVSLPII